ncbi:MAG: four helix bundle protein [Bacteroidetes bacterium]|nr:four helix bundle protein [Bacteroidota bacterium]MBP6315418.1 four helix bundle protein [Chitinophagaceae bacterium]
MRNDKQNLIVELTFQFAIKSVLYCELLEMERKYVISRQLLKSSTSIGANVREAQNAESKNDFIHKMKIAAKESDETRYWLEIILEIPSYPQNTELLDLLKPIELIINKIISSSKKYVNGQKPS